MAFKFNTRLRRAASLNNTRRNHLALRLSGNGQPYEADTISFAASGDTIDDSATSMPVYPDGSLIKVTGSNSKNGRTFKVGTGAADSMDLTPAMVADESAGNKILVRSV